jgi:uncharacterized membrane protein YkvA (DUF1232 family)
MKLPVKWIYNLHRTALHHPQYRWVVIFGTLIYLVSPIDLSPDLLPLLGQIDDIALVMLLVTGLSEIITQYFQGNGREFTQTEVQNSQKHSETNQTIDVDAVSVD